MAPSSNWKNLMNNMVTKNHVVRHSKNKNATNNAQIISSLIGPIHWPDMTETSNEYEYFKNATVNDKPILPYLVFLKKGKMDKKENLNEPANVEINGEMVKIGNKSWTIEMKLVPSDKLMKSITNCLHWFVPSGASVSIQADAHNAGNIVVGWISSFDSGNISINLISGDIGCGMTVLPVAKNDVQLKADDDNQVFSVWMMYMARKMLKRGRIVEKVESFGEVSPFIKEAASFYTSSSDLSEFLTKMKYVLDMIGLKYDKENGSDDLERVLLYISRFAQTLGSSGNHFLELCADKNDMMWLVIHSGSRALGAIIYEAISIVATFMTGSSEMAIGPLAIFYAKAYDVLNTFARLNRALCGIAVLSAMKLEWNGEKLSKIMMKNELFLGSPEKAVYSLLQGLTHNGIKVFANHEKKLKIYILSKGAVSVSDKAACVLIALKAGEGNYLFTLVNNDSPWEEVTLEEASCLDYKTTLDIKETDGHVILAGHGAGRAASATDTWRKFGYEDLVEYFRSKKIVANIGPNVLGDHPDGYKDTSEIMSKLPLNMAKNHSQLRTLMSYKENLDYRPAWAAKCVDHFKKTYHIHGDEPRDFEKSIQNAMCDIYLIAFKNDDFIKSVEDEHKKTYEFFEEKAYECYE